MLKLTWRYIASNLKSSIRAVSGIAFSVMLMFSLIQISGCIKDRFKEMASSGMHRDFTVYDISSEDVIRLQEKLDKTPLYPHQKSMSTIWVGTVYENELEGYKVVGIGGDIAYFKDTSFIEGKMPSADNEILIEESYAKEKGGLRTGDKLSLSIEYAFSESPEAVNKTSDFVISGVIRDVVDEGTFFFTSLHGAASLISESGVVYDDLSNAVAYEAEEGNFSVDKSVDAEMKIRDILFEKDSPQAKTFFKDNIINNEHKSEVYEEKGFYSGLADGISLLSVIIAVCMVIFVYNTLNSNLLGKLDNISTMRCIGLNNQQLSSMILTEAFILTDIGFIIGVLSGNVLNHIIADKLISLITSSAVHSRHLSQNILIYLISYGLALISSLFACIRLIYRIKGLKPANIRKFEGKKIKESSYSSKGINSRHYFTGLAVRNIRRNFSKSLIQLVTVTLSFTICFVICNTFMVINQKKGTTVYDISDYAVKSDMNYQLTRQDMANISGEFDVSDIYTQKVLYLYKVNAEESNVVVYDDELMKLLCDSLGIKYSSKNDCAVLFTNDGTDVSEADVTHGSERETVRLNGCFSADTENLACFLGMTDKKLIINNTAAEKLGADTSGYSTILIRSSSKIDSSRISGLIGDDSGFVFEDFSEGTAASQKQLLGMMILAGYIIAATFFISFLIIGNTIRENTILRKREFGVMRAIGMEIKELCKVSCIENLILTMIPCIIGIIVSAAANVYITHIIFEKHRISVLAYVAVIVLITVSIETFTYFHMKKSLSTEISDVLRCE